MNGTSKQKIVCILGFLEKESDIFCRNVSDVFSKEYDVMFIELYHGKPFGSYSFKDEIERIDQVVRNISPKYIFGHSLGGYISTFLSHTCINFLFDPSVSISRIILNNLSDIENIPHYYDGEYKIKLSNSFVKTLSEYIDVQSPNVIKNFDSKFYIFGAGLAGHKIAYKYHLAIKNSEFTLLPDTDHNFSSKNDFEKVYGEIKKAQN